MARDGSTLLTRVLKWILYKTLAVSFPVSQSCLVDNCIQLLPGGYIFQQDGAPAHAARATQNWLEINCPDLTDKDQWPPNSPDLNPLDYHVWGAMLEAYHKRHPKPKTITELKETLQAIWDRLPQGSIDRAVKQFSKRLKACVAADGGHFEYWKSL